MQIHQENTPDKSPQQRWNERNREAIGKSQRKYEQKKPVISFRPTPEVRAKLEELREAGEGDTDLLNRLLLAFRG